MCSWQDPLCFDENSISDTRPEKFDMRHANQSGCPARFIDGCWSAESADVLEWTPSERTRGTVAIWRAR